MTSRVWGGGLLVGAVLLLAGGTASGDDKKDNKPFIKPADDQTFILMAASGGKMEVELGKLMAQKAKHDAVKKFAQKMVDDHTKANKELKTVAQNLSIQIPEVMDARHRKMVEHFRQSVGTGAGTGTGTGTAGGMDLDREYMRHMVMDHMEDVALFRYASQEAKHQEVKQFATKTLPVLEGHLSLARKIRGQLDGQGGGKGGDKGGSGSGSGNRTGGDRDK